MSTRPCILIVEDEPLWRGVLQHRLTIAGYHVECLANGQVALNWLDHAPELPALILTDLLMPQASGYDLCRGVRNNPRLAHLPIVVMSSMSTRDFQQSAHDLGVFRYLIKPLPATEVVATISAALAR